MNNSKGYFYYLVWIVGAIVLVYYGQQFTHMMDQKTGTLYKMDYSLLGDIVYSFVFGLYLSFLSGWPRRKSLHRPLFFFVFLPSLILLLYPLITIYINQIRITGYQQWVGQVQLFFIGLLSGYSLMKSLFSSK
ncbi:hypothetical protein [Paenibacillus macerans]|uniref:hypothetical protein n=1 Tax=Paenibacillus macerans TaxID=44252 RepID=UPI00203C9284|nr:hypothetical protein [Paenibacillus macerans]MCM3698987.1 hypothetical protein [Paenibacillus macerans]